MQQITEENGMFLKSKIFRGPVMHAVLVADVGLVAMAGLRPRSRRCTAFARTVCKAAPMGYDPEAGLVMDGSGGLYGTTEAGGGSFSFFPGFGTVFEFGR